MDKALSLDELEAVSGGQKWGNGVWGPGLLEGGLRRYRRARQQLLGDRRKLLDRECILYTRTGRCKMSQLRRLLLCRRSESLSRLPEMRQRVLWVKTGLRQAEIL